MPLHSRAQLPRAATTVLSISAVTLCATVVPTAYATPAADNVVISEVYGGGGNKGAELTNDFVELYNPTSAPISLDGWAVQYLSSKATQANHTIALTGSIPAGGHYLIQGAKGSGGSTSFSSDLQADSLAMSGSSGSIVLTNNTDTWAEGSAAVDIVGYGSTKVAEGASAPGTSNADSVSRNAAGTDSDNNAADFTKGLPTPQFTGGDATTQPSNPGGDGGDGGTDPGNPTDPTPGDKTPIDTIQGTGDASPLLDKTVTTTGWVTANYPEGGLNGFVIQMGGTGTAARAAGEASQAIFIYSRDQHPSALDKCVVVTGKVGEFKTSTQLAASTIKESDNPAVDCGEKPRPITDAIPTDTAQREANEHMLFQPSGDYTVTNNYELSSYGSVDLVAGDKPLYQATQMVAPGPDAVAYEENNKRQVITLDDGSTRNYFTNDQAKEVPLPYLSSAEGIKSLRTGDVVHFQQPAVLSFNFDKWGLQPTGEITGATGRGALPIEWADSRPAEVNGPENVGGDLSLASFNVLNYFTDLGKDEPGCKAYRDRVGNPVTTDYCTVRGAYTEQAFHDQQAKIVRAINTLNVSVLGLEEIENSAKFGHDRDASLGNLVDALNAAGGNWKYVPSPASLPGSEDVIRTAFIYNPDKVSPVGESRILDHEAFTDIARQPLAQEFQVAGAGRMVAVVNHFKSKGSVARGDADTGDGQGNNARLRKEMSVQLTQWLKEQKDWAELPQFVMGDLNSYAKEDALRVLEDAGFSNVEDRFDAGSSYQYAGRVGSLDHVLGNAAAMKLVTGADVWDINSDEATSFEYSRRNYNVVDFYAPDVFRGSDHDPIKVGLTAPAPQGGGDGNGNGDGGSGGNGNGGDTGQPGQPGAGGSTGSGGSGGSGGTGGGSNGGSTGGVMGSVQSAWDSITALPRPARAAVIGGIIGAFLGGAALGGLLGGIFGFGANREFFSFLDRWF